MGGKGTGKGRGTGDETINASSLLHLCFLEGCLGVLAVEEVPPSPRTRLDILH